MIPGKVPACYGHLFNIDTQACQCCLLNEVCPKAMNAPKIPVGAQVGTLARIPTDKRELILWLCKRYNIPTTYWSKKLQCEYEVTSENMHEFHNLDFLLTSKIALERLATVEFAE